MDANQETGNNTMQISSMMLAAALTMFGTQNMSQGVETGLTKLPCRVTAIYNTDIPADLPAQQGGTLRSIDVKVGDYVKKGDVLAVVDDELEALSLEVSKQRLAMAQEEADNDVNVRYADMATKVARYEYQTVLDAVNNTPEAFTRTEVIKYSLSVDQLILQKEQAEHEQNLARMSVRVREAEYQLAQHELARRTIKAPVEGVIDAVHCVVGDWVRAGDPIVKLIQMDRLQIKSTLPYGPLTPADVRGKPVVVRIKDLAPSILARDTLKGRFEGVVDSTGSEFGRGEIPIIVEVINRRDPQTGDWMLLPGMDGEMEIQGITAKQ